MNNLLVLPILVPLCAAAACLFAWPWRVFQRWLSLASAAALLAAGAALVAVVEAQGVQAIQIGAWPAPYGISLVADLFAAIMVLVAGVIGLAVAVYSLAAMDPARESFGYYPLLHTLLAGVCGAFLTGDIFNLFVWFEVMLIASFVLMALGGERGQLEGAIKYVTLNLIASAVFLTAIGILYGAARTLNMADLHGKLQDVPAGLNLALAMLFLVAFGIKAALFPLYFWLPASYHTPPAAVSALFTGLLTKVGVYALIRVFTLLFVQAPSFTHSILLIISGVTMVSGVLGAMIQNDFRRLLSFHIISQIGYMVMGLGLAGLASSAELAVNALAASIFMIVHNIIVKTNLFLVSGVVQRIQGSSQLAALGGLSAAYPVLAALFLISALSLAGLPPLSGFIAKFALVWAGLEQGQYAIVVTALAVSLLTLYSMSKIWVQVFWKPAPEPVPLRVPGYPTLLLPVALLAALAVAIGLGAGPLWALARQAAEQLHDPSSYLQAVGLSPP